MAPACLRKLSLSLRGTRCCAGPGKSLPILRSFWQKSVNGICVVKNGQEYGHGEDEVDRA